MGQLRLAANAICGRPHRPAARQALRIAMLGALLGTSACASLSASPEAVITPAAMRDATAVDTVKVAMDKFYAASDSQRGNLTAKAYRNRIIGLYMNAIDANYYAFRNRLTQDERETAIGMDMLLLGLAGAASIARTAAVDELTAGIAVVTGARATIDKNLFFDRTLPAVLSATEAERAKARRTILEKMRLDDLEYPIVAAFADLQDYQLAGTLERGVSRMTEIASTDSAAEKERLDNAVLVCRSTSPNRATLTARLRTLVGYPNLLADAEQTRRLGLAAGKVGVTADPANNKATWDKIYAALGAKYCSDEERTAIIDDIQAAIG